MDPDYKHLFVGTHCYLFGIYWTTLVSFDSTLTTVEWTYLMGLADIASGFNFETHLNVIDYKVGTDSDYDYLSGSTKIVDSSYTSYSLFYHFFLLERATNSVIF
jgi:hypothetical protein